MIFIRQVITTPRLCLISHASTSRRGGPPVRMATGSKAEDEKKPLFLPGRTSTAGYSSVDFLQSSHAGKGVGHWADDPYLCISCFVCAVIFTCPSRCPLTVVKRPRFVICGPFRPNRLRLVTYILFVRLPGNTSPYPCCGMYQLIFNTNG